jgi:hypothetical protein
MQLTFSDQSTIELLFLNNSIGQAYSKIYKHLSAVPIPFRSWDNPYYSDILPLTYNETVEQLVTCGRLLSVDVDAMRCLSQDQEYFNFIHQIYEKRYNGNTTWQDFNRYIHVCEGYFTQDNNKILCIDYREKAGLLQKSMTTEWLQTTTTQIKQGDIFVSWAEIGKTPYEYWRDKEPSNIKRMYELAKPWLKLKPRILVAMNNIDRLTDIDVDQFEMWWEPYQKNWAQYWGLPRWNTNDIFGVIVLGKVSQIDLLTQNLKNNIIPTKISLEKLV